MFIKQIQTNNTSCVKLIDIKTLKTNIILSDFPYIHSPKFDQHNRFIFFYANTISTNIDSLKYDYCFKSEYKLYAISLTSTPLNQYWKLNSENIENIKINEINLEELSNKIEILPVEAKNFIQINQFDKDELILISKEKKEFEFTKFSLKTFKEESVFKKITDFYIQENTKYFVLEEKEKVYAINYEKITDEIAIDLNRISLQNNIKEEIQNKFDEICFYIKHLFHDEKLNDIKLNDIIQRYQKEIDRFDNHEDFYNLLNQLQGELKTSHAYIYEPVNSTNNIGRLGAIIEYDYINNKYIIKKILNHDYINKVFSPLKQQNIKENSIINKINGQILNIPNSLELALQNQSEKYIELEIIENDIVKNIEIKCLNSQDKLVYQTYIEENQKYIENIDKNIGYIHIPDMSGDGYKQFFFKYLSQFNKEYLIVDLRNNRGGNVSHLIYDYLSRKLLGCDLPRNIKDFQSLPMETTKNNMVFLINEYTAFYDKSLKEIENFGVTPDIEVENSVLSEKNNCKSDVQLNYAIQELLKNI